MADSDVDISAGFAALLEQYADPGVPAASVVEAAHRRRRRTQSLSVAAAVVAVAVVATVIPLLVSSGRGGATRPAVRPTPTATASVGGLQALKDLPKGRVTAPISIDHGAFRIDPEPAGYRPQVPARLAEQVVDRINNDEPSAPVPSYGLVTIAPSVTRSLPAYQSRSAWITVIPISPFAGDCPAMQSKGPKNAPDSVTVILTDANTGRGSILYDSVGRGPCGSYSSRPGTDIAEETIGLRWTLLGERPDPTQAGSVDWHISFRVPSCALTDTGPGLTENRARQTMLYVETEMPIDRPRSCPTTLRTIWWGPEREDGSTIKHALTGRHYY
jgi:hypothetical protein